MKSASSVNLSSFLMLLFYRGSSLISQSNVTVPDDLPPSVRELFTYCYLFCIVLLWFSVLWSFRFLLNLFVTKGLIFNFILTSHIQSIVAVYVFYVLTPAVTSRAVNTYLSHTDRSKGSIVKWPMVSSSGNPTCDHSDFFVIINFSIVPKTIIRERLVRVYS